MGGEKGGVTSPGALFADFLNREFGFRWVPLMGLTATDVPRHFKDVALTSAMALTACDIAHCHISMCWGCGSRGSDSRPMSDPLVFSNFWYLVPAATYLLKGYDLPGMFVGISAVCSTGYHMRREKQGFWAIADKLAAVTAFLTTVSASLDLSRCPIRVVYLYPIPFLIVYLQQCN
ncbi:hypothetical protein AAMO2058_001278600 [Amorphochlora amoebiformis]